MYQDITSLPPDSVLSPELEADMTCSVEFFHIYTDEDINESHEATLDYLLAVRKDWEFKSQNIVLIDNYNPTEHKLTPDIIFEHLRKRDVVPDFWAFEADLVANAGIFLDKITSSKLKNNYSRYIDKHGKYPCSLLTASWYLTRLGYLRHDDVIQTVNEGTYTPATILINILPDDYKAVEGRCLELIENSEFKSAIDSIQNVLIPVECHNKTSL